MSAPSSLYRGGPARNATSYRSRFRHPRSQPAAMGFVIPGSGRRGVDDVRLRFRGHVQDVPRRIQGHGRRPSLLHPPSLRPRRRLPRVPAHSLRYVHRRGKRDPSLWPHADRADHRADHRRGYRRILARHRRADEPPPESGRVHGARRRAPPPTSRNSREGRRPRQGRVRQGLGDHGRARRARPAVP